MDPDEPLPLTCAVLTHPNGTRVYLVGTAHVSSESAREVADVVARVQPAAVVLELDEGRYRRLLQSADEGDVYGLRRSQTPGSLALGAMAVTGRALPHAMRLVYVVAGAVLGTPPGAEFLAAREAAEQVGASVVLADRPERVTLNRLQAYTRQLQAGGARAPRNTAPGLAGLAPGPDSDEEEGQRDPGSMPGFLPGGGGPSRAGGGAGGKPPGPTAPQGDTWGLGEEGATE